MGLFDAVRRRLAARVPQGDAGTTLIELLVGMLIMAIFMGMFTGAMLMMSNTSNKVQAITLTANQQSDAYFQLDREIRYASAISTPSFDNNMWHVEFATNVVNRTNSTATTTNKCTQLAVAPPSGVGGSVGVLKQRTWNVGDSSPGAWTVLASYVTDYKSTDKPFPTTSSIATGGASTSMQQLTISLTMTSALGSASTVSSYTFTALNSTTTTNGAANTSVCQQFSVGS